jgi:probable rRNA maturation factor
VSRRLHRRLTKANQKKELAKELVVVFVDKEEAQRLNFQFRGKNYATDVLSFSSIAGDAIGELVLCPDILQLQAREIGWSFRNEAAYMCLHGLLHLLGFDHEKSERQARRMFSLQDDIFFGELKCLRSGASL